MSKKLSEHKISQIRVLHEEGHSYVSIGEIIGCSNVTVKNWICRGKIKTTQYNKKLPRISNDEIITRYQDGQSARTIAKIAKCSRHEILNILKKNGINVVRRIIDEQLTTKIIDEYYSGKSINELSQKYNFGHVSIWRLLKRNDVDLRNKFFTDKEIKHVVNLYNQGNSCHQISDKIGRNDCAIAQNLKKNNVIIRSNSGCNNPAWKGGIYPINLAIRDGVLYDIWKQQNYLKSNNKSLITHKHGVLNVHHIYPFRIILKSSLTKHICLSDEYKNKTMINDDRFYDLNNGLVITEQEHKLIEQSPHNCHPWWRIWKHFPEFAIEKSGYQFLIFDENGQINPQNSIIVKSNKDEVKQIIRYEHYLGTIPPSQLILTAKFNDIITGIATFGRPNRHMKKDTWELTRLCVPHYVVRPFTIQFLHMCINYIRKNHKNISNILSYSDTSVGHDGAVYRMSGFKNCGYTPPGYAYLDLNAYQLKHKSFCRRIKGVNKTEKELAIERNLIKIPLTPKKRWNYGV